MEPMIKEYILSLIRTLLSPFAIWLGKSGYVTEDAAGQFVIGLAGVLLAVVWSLANKYFWKKTTEAALAKPASTSPTVLQNVIANSGSK